MSNSVTVTVPAATSTIFINATTYAAYILGVTITDGNNNPIFQGSGSGTPGSIELTSVPPVTGASTSWTVVIKSNGPSNPSINLNNSSTSDPNFSYIVIGANDGGTNVCDFNASVFLYWSSGIS
jgi:hypothetical protein